MMMGAKSSLKLASCQRGTMRFFRAWVFIPLRNFWQVGRCHLTVAGRGSGQGGMRNDRAKSGDIARRNTGQSYCFFLESSECNIRDSKLSPVWRIGVDGKSHSRKKGEVMAICLLLWQCSSGFGDGVLAGQIAVWQIGRASCR